MAKGNPNSAAVQYKVHLKPTEVGLLVMKRMERPHLDKSAELRRFIELGYAAEQAGFILDGTVLRHAGRMWDTQPDLTAQALNHSAPSPDQQAAQPTRPPVRRSAKPTPEAASLGAGDATPALPAEKADVTSAPASSLRGKLRGLSG